MMSLNGSGQSLSKGHLSPLMGWPYRESSDLEYLAGTLGQGAPPV